MIRNLLFIFIAVISTTAFAQNQVISKLKQPPPNKFGIADLWALELNNTTQQDLSIYVTGTLTEETDGLIVEARSKPFLIKPGRHTYNYNNFSNASVGYSNNKYREILLRTGNAPEGNYTICIEVYSEDGDLVGIENCIYHSVKQLGSISLLTPADGDETMADQPVIFNWTPLPDAKEYSIKIVEILGNQSPEIAIQQNPAFFSKENIRATQFQYPISERKFQADKSYVWVISSGGVLSEVCSFKVKSSTITSEDELTKNYRFILMYPDGGIETQSIDNFQGELEEFARILIGDQGVKPGTVNMIKPKQTQGATFGERVNTELINFFTNEESREFGEEILILTGDTPTGKIVQCPPAGCGCPGVSCNCVSLHENSICICKVCDDIGLDFGFLPPPNNNNGITTKDILILLASDPGEFDESFANVVKLGVNKVAEARNNKVEALVIKQSYEKERKQEKNYRFILMHPDGGIEAQTIDNFQGELEEFARILIGDQGVKPGSFGARVSSELIHFFTNEESREFGEEILILTGDIPTGKIVQCPPAGCGCTRSGGISCSCSFWQGSGDGICLCNLCLDYSAEIELIKLPPPNNNNGITTKDILILLASDPGEFDESFANVVKLGLNKVAEARKNKVEALVIKQSYEKESTQEIKYRFVLMYPDGKVQIEKMHNIGDALAESFKMMKIDGGMPNRISMNVSTGRINPELQQLAEDMFNLVESQPEHNFGNGLAIITAKQTPCPPPGCGCRDASSINSCQCFLYQGECWCIICVDVCTLPDWEVDDPVLTLRTVSGPPSTSGPVKIMDVIVVFIDSESNECIALRSGLKRGLETVTDLRTNNALEPLVIKQSYNIPERKVSLTDFLASNEDIIFEYEPEKYVKINSGYLFLKDESKSSLGNLCRCPGFTILVHCVESCEQCCAVFDQAVDLIDFTPEYANRNQTMAEEVNRFLAGINLVFKYEQKR